MAKYITEVLKEINDDVSLLQTKYKKNGDGGPLGTAFRHAFMADHKFLLPAGDPPFKPSPEPMGMTPQQFLGIIRTFYVLMRKDLPAKKREGIFIQMCEGIHPSEAKILLAVKDQTLTKLYPNITHKVVAAAGFVPAVPEEEVKVEKKVKVAEAKKSTGMRFGKPIKVKE